MSRIPDISHLVPRVFWPYTSGVMYDGRFETVEYTNGDDIDQWRDELVKLFQSKGIKAHTDNKIVFEFFDPKTEKPTYIGFYDLKMSRGPRMKSDHEMGIYKPFLPSEVVLLPPPLVGTMEAAEREAAAALYVRACQVLGDKWQPLSLKQIGEVVDADLKEKNEPLNALSTNPFFRPSVPKLVDGKYGQWTGTPNESPIELTKKGLYALRRWVRWE